MGIHPVVITLRILTTITHLQWEEELQEKGERKKLRDLARHFRERYCLNLFWEGPDD